MAGDRDTRTTCLSAVDSKTRCSTASRWLCPPCSRRQRDEEDEDDVCRLPDSVVVDHQNYFLLKQLTEEKRKKHKEVLKEMKKELTHLTQVCDSQVRTAVEELLASLKDLDLRLNPLMERNEQLDLLSTQEVHVLWEEVQEKVKMKKMRIKDLNHKLTECETQRASKVRVLLVKNVHLLENISFLPPPDVFRLIHTEATMLNLSLLMNRRCAARLTLLLLEENLQQEEQLRLQWEELLSCWRRSKATGVLDRYWTLCSSDEEQPLVSGQLVEQREETIHHICSLVPPSCSTTLASDWFNQLTVINQQIDDLHSEVLHQLRCRSHHRWSEHLARVELCEKKLSALQLSDVEMNDVIGSQLLAVIGQGQSQDEQRLAAVDRCCDAVARRALHLSTCVFAVMRGAALLWETHSRRIERRRVQVEQRIQQQHTQGEKVHLCEQVSSEEALDETIGYLEDVKHSSTGCVSDQVEVLERLPFVLLEELLSYSSSLSSFFHLDHTYKPSPEELQNLHPNLHSFSTQMGQCEAQIKKPEKKMEASGPTHLSPDWLTEAESSLQALSDMSSDVMFTSSRGVAYTGPAFRCTAPDLPDLLQLEMHLSPFPVELLTETLSRTRTLFLDHLEQHVKDVLSSAVTTVKERSKAAYWGRELQLKQLKIQHTQKQMYTPRLAELQLHTRLVKSHSEEVSDVLTSLRVEHQEHQAVLSERKQEVILNLSHVEAEAQRANSSTRLHALSSTLKGCLDQHIKDTQHLQTTFRQTVIVQLDRVKTRTAQLLSTFRLFREGGDFAPEELNSFQKKLKEETRRIRVTEESIYSELEEFESHNLKQLKETSEGLEEKLYSMRSELDFIEQIQDTMRKTRVQMKAEAASSKQQQIIISSKLEDLRKMMENTQVFTDQVCSLLSAVNEEFRKRCRYLDCPLVSSLSVLSVHESGQQVQSNSPPGLLQRRRTREDLLQDPLVEVIRSLNRSCEIQNAAAAEGEERGESPAGQSPVQQKCTQPLRLRRGDKSIRTERKFQVFGPEPEENPHSFSSSLNSLLWRTNDVLLLVAEDFYRRERSVLSRFLRVPDRLDQWAEGMQQRLLGYQDQMKKFLCMSREELDSQLRLLENLLLSLPAVLICNHEQRQEAELIEEVTEVRVKLEEKLSASEEEKSMNVKRLRVSLGEEELLSLSSREELRQQQLHSDICSLHLELQVCVKVRGEEFVTSLALLTEKLLSQLDELLLPEEAVQRSEVNTVTVATKEETGRKPCTVSRTRPGDSSPTNKDTDPPSGVTMATTTSVTTSRCTLGHQVIEQRDAAEKRLQQVLLLELSRSDEDKRRRLSELQSWNAHWRQQIHTLKQHTHTEAEM